jgi:hypothetical protein
MSDDSSARLEQKLTRLAELMPPDQFAQFLERLDWVIDALLAGATEDDLKQVLQALPKPGRA